MDKFLLPTKVIINDVECEFNSDFRDVLNIFTILNDPDLLDSEKLFIASQHFYLTDDYITDYETAIKQMLLFLNVGEAEPKSNANKKPLYDWEQDFNIIVAPINKIIGKDVRGLDYLHWWTFMSAFMEIGECTFNTYVGIRDKLNRGKKLEDYEKTIYKENRDKIVLKQKYDTTTQDIINDILGRS